MDVGRPYSALAPGIEGDVLAVLAGTSRPLTGREVARLGRRGSAAGVNKALARLAAHGLVRREPAGRAYLYTLNRDHLAAPAVLALTAMRGELIRRLRDELSSWSSTPLHASLFGSAARGDGTVRSDIDLLLVRPQGVGDADPSWRDHVARLHDRVEAWTGNPVTVIELAADEIGDVRRIGGLGEDAIDLAGQTIRGLIAAPTA